MEAPEYEAMRIAELTHWWYRALHREVIFHLRRQPRMECVLDLGCGTGGTMTRLAEALPKLTCVGMDYSTLALEACQRRGFSALVQGDAKCLPFGSERFDAITCLDVLYTKQAYPGMPDCLARSRDMLRPGGVLIMQLPAFEGLRSSHDAHVHGVHRFRSGEVREALGAAGFARTRVYYRYNALAFPAWLLRRTTHAERDESHVETPGGLVNSFMDLCMRIEAPIARALPLPVGVSVFAVAWRD
jgi:predicted TPR repeat methyltransferase